MRTDESKGHHVGWMHVKLVRLQDVVAFILNEFSKNRVLQGITFPDLESSIRSPATRWVTTVNLMEHMTDGAKKGDRAYPEYPPGSVVGYFTVREHQTCGVGHRF